MDNKNKRVKYYIVLHIGILIYALTGICSKFAAQQSFLSFYFVIFYGGMLAALFVYAIIWQQVLKHLSLTTAFLNKSVAIIWGMFFGFIIFNEKVTLNMVIGAIIVLFGVSLVVTDGDV